MSTIIITVDSVEPDRLFASTVRDMRRSLHVTRTQLARASGVPRRSIAAIEAGGATTRAQRHDIAIAVSWLSSNRVAKGLAKTN
jgi:DNA-binding XRE family transcriptional regulator